MREQDRKAQETRKLLGPRLGRTKAKAVGRVYSDLPIMRRQTGPRLPRDGA